MVFSFRSGILVFCIGFFSQLFTITSAQQLSPDLLKQYETYKSQQQNNPEASRLLQEYDSRQKELNRSRKIIDTVPSSIADSADTTDSLHTKPKLSIYESLLRGESIDPDKIVSSLTLYGYNLFDKSKLSTFAPTDFASVPADYPINVGDEIVINLWGRINEEYRLKVSRVGSITIPRIGPISVNGLSYSVMRQNILDRVGKIEGVNASVAMGELRTIGVYIVGEVKSPGFYTISALSSVTNALFSAGGPTKNGSLRNVQLKRNGKLVSNIDFYDFLMAGNDKTGLRLQSGDVILVPIIKSMAAIVGNVRRSALYELNENTSLKNLIEIAGGITPAAWINKIQVERFSKNQYQIVLDLDSVNVDVPSFKIHDGDIVKIFPILRKDKNVIYLSGNVVRPGKYEFKDGIHITDIIPDYLSLLPETYFEYAIVLRQEPPSFLNRIITFNLKNALDNPGNNDDLLLQERDQILIYNKDFFEPDRSISIDGAVTNPGTYKLLNDMKIRDLILQAGGLTDDASTERGELYRRNINSNNDLNVEKKDFSVSGAMQDNPEHNQVLHRTDRVFIRSKKGWTDERKVTLRGQFTYPGTYVLFEGESLGDLIKRANGFKEDAYLSAAVFTRKSVKDMQLRQFSEYSRQVELDILKLSTEAAANDQNSTETWDLMSRQMALKNKVDSNSVIGRVVIDLQNENSYNDFALENGDDLYVPRNLNTVSVFGEVYNPATFKYQDNNSKASYYIEIAGGIKENSDKKNIYIIRANGSIITNKIARVRILQTTTR